jgi:uroporphyrinogen-III synthase
MDQAFVAGTPGELAQDEKNEMSVLLLKTKSLPDDGYQELFDALKLGARSLEPVFVPVMEHTLVEEGLDIVRKLLRERKYGCGEGCRYGGLVFTSQRAVEAFAKLVEEGGELLYCLGNHMGQLANYNITDSAEKAETGLWPYLHDVPIYTVGPATTRALRAVTQTPALQIFGEESGNGEALAHYMLEHYNSWYAGRTKLPLHFLVGETRRDIIPKTLMDPALPDNKRIMIDELVVYGTGVVESFERDFTAELKRTEDRDLRWVVVFSPTGCEAALRSLGLLDQATGRVKMGERGGGCGSRRGKRNIYVATIGPTTRDYLRKMFGFEPDVCAEKPSPKGVADGIQRFMEKVEKCES